MTLLDHAALDLDAADRITYRIDQRFRYDYAEPVTSLRQRLVVVPRRRHGDAYLRSHAVMTSGARSRRRTYRDAVGNTVVRVFVAQVEATVEFTVTALVEHVRASAPSADLDHAWWHQSTRLTAADPGLRDFAASLAQGTPAEVAERVCVAVHGAIAYTEGVTTVETTAAEALTGGRGVCQDAAHVMVAVCHLLGLPARYVSGHLLGQGGTHAWVEVAVAGHRVLAFDPCNGCRTDRRYVTVAVGRDYADVAPTSGSFTGATGGRLSAARTVGVVSVD